ncbi:MAG: FHA domain-containing protein [Bdellovibrionales bacterium]|nr:FHA domain-containing protein [Bdellovibrionales bacterium]
MAFRYVTETVNKNGSKETSLKELDQSEILLGRGASSDILLTGRLVSLRHAQLVVGAESLTIQDLESLSGVRVNDQLITKVELHRGDVVKIGNYTFTVTRDDGVWGVLERRSDLAQEEDAEAVIDGQVKKLSFQSYIPSFTVLSVILSLVVVGFFFAAPLSGTNIRSWNSGPISNAHKMIENDCGQCHAEAFTRVRDAECMACHSMSDHAPSLPALVEKHPTLGFRCASCHMEHNGDAGIIATDVKLCADCHGGLDSLLPGTGTPEIPSWHAHPEFRVSVPQPVGAEQPFKKVSLDASDLSDPTKLKLNHQIHLEPDLAGRDGLVTMQCQDCHEPTDDLHEIKPINFERHCSDCHSLEYDERLPGQSVPHGSPDVVYNYLYAQYAQLFLRKEGVEEEQPSSRRRMPGRTEARLPDIEFSRASVNEQARNTEEALFTRTACHLCHFVTDMPDAGAGESRYAVESPAIPQKWMPDSTFNHGAHQEVSCESCHVDVRKSEKTTDLLLPGKENCYQCHAEAHVAGKVDSACVTCHSYHKPLVMEEDKKRTIERILMTRSGSFQASASRSSVGESRPQGSESRPQ